MAQTSFLRLHKNSRLTSVDESTLTAVLHHVQLIFQNSKSSYSRIGPIYQKPCLQVQTFSTRNMSVKVSGGRVHSQPSLLNVEVQVSFKTTLCNSTNYTVILLRSWRPLPLNWLYNYVWAITDQFQIKLPKSTAFTLDLHIITCWHK